jgi:hypothetical protein
MYVLLTKYQVNPIFEHEFRDAWLLYCDALKKDDLLLRATLFRESKITYLSQTYWPDHLDYKELHNHPPLKYLSDIQRIEEYSNRIVILHRMDLIHEKS